MEASHPRVELQERNFKIWYLENKDIVLLATFFFQAEDGIRDLTVTGVQTCALPISRVDALVVGAGPAGSNTARLLAKDGHRVLLLEEDEVVGERSEERRVGKECRSR